MIRSLLTMLAVVLLCACSDSQPEMAEQNAVYYWRTELRLDSGERAFLAQHHIKKVYCRYFDVVMGDDVVPVPNATIAFSDTLPAGVELVPTVYITEDCMHQRHEGLAERIVRRILQMNETNDIYGVSELQIDCDYTSNSRRIYYEFLKEVANEWSHLSPYPSHHSPHISTTIRLHQLSMPAPPVDYGVLMLYNTGDPRKFLDLRSADGRLLEEGKNPVLDIRDVMPYVRRLDDYALPLAAAYPVYLWVRNISGVRVEHFVEADEILRVKQAVEKKRPELSRTIITYHLDKENINRYKPETYESIYHH